MIFIMVLNLAINFSYIIIKATKVAFLKLRKWYYTRKLNKLLKLAEERANKKAMIEEELRQLKEEQLI